jgi:predicted RNA-binding Zn-ribbon protein involved in translation (DUF1610 family)
MTTTNLTSEEKEACREKAGEHLIAVLRGERSPYEGEDRVYRILSDLCATRDNFAHTAKEIRDAVDRALPYVSGEAATFNSLGILHTSGVRLDQYAMLFAKQAEYAKQELTDFYYRQAEAERDAEGEGETCPRCGSSDLLHGVTEDDEEDGTYVCEDCGYEGRTAEGKERDRHIAAQGAEAGFSAEEVLAARKRVVADADREQAEAAWERETEARNR